MFENLKKMTNLKYVDLSSKSECVTNSYSYSPKMEDWKYEKCNDDVSKTENLERITERESFFTELFPGCHVTDRKMKLLQDSNKQLRHELNEAKLKLAKLEEFFELLF